MKVFLVSLILLILVAALFFAVSSQNTIAPIVYLHLPLNDETYPPDFNFQVMDVNTSEIIFESATEVADCPYSLSPDGRWLLYRTSIGQLNVEYKLLNLVSGRQTSPNLALNRFSSFYWFSDSSGFMLSTINEAQSNASSIYRYDINSETLNAIITNSSSSLTIYRAGDSFVYADNNYEQNLITIYQLDGLSKSFEFSGRVGIISFSNDARFMLYSAYNESSSKSELNILDTSNGDIHLLEDAQVEGGGTWNPITNQLLYHVEIRDGNTVDYQVVEYDPITRERQNLYSHGYFLDMVNYYWGGCPKSFD